MGRGVLEKTKHHRAPALAHRPPLVFTIGSGVVVTHRLSVKHKVVRNSAFHDGELNDERIAEILKAVPEITPTSKKEGRTSSDNTDRAGFAGRQFSR
jgi:hypothetical protein